MSLAAPGRLDAVEYEELVARVRARVATAIPAG